MQIPLTSSVESRKINLFYDLYKLYVVQISVIGIAMSKVKTQTNNVNVRLSDHVMTCLNDISNKKGMSRTEYLRFLIHTAIEKETV